MLWPTCATNQTRDKLKNIKRHIVKITILITINLTFHLFQEHETLINTQLLSVFHE